MSLRSNVRDLKLNKQPIYVLEAELFEISQQNKLNKDARNRKRLEQVILAKKYAAMKVT